MVGEKFAANVLKETLGLCPEDTKALQDVIAWMKEQGPELMEQIPLYIERAEATERAIRAIDVRVQALCFYFKATEPEKWADAETKALEYLKKKEMKATTVATVHPKEG